MIDTHLPFWVTALSTIRERETLEEALRNKLPNDPQFKKALSSFRENITRERRIFNGRSDGCEVVYVDRDGEERFIDTRAFLWATLPGAMADFGGALDGDVAACAMTPEYTVVLMNKNRTNSPSTLFVADGTCELEFKVGRKVQTIAEAIEEIGRTNPKAKTFLTPIETKLAECNLLDFGKR